jgi:hypothetical protein
LTAVVAISAPRGGPLGRPSGCGGGAGRGGGVVVAFGGVAAFVPPALDLVAAAFVPPAVAARDFVAAAFVPPAADLVAAALGFVAPAFEFVASARDRPSRAGRVEGRLPSTLCWAAARAAFLLFFFPDFSAMPSALERDFALLRASTGYSQRPKPPPRLVDFKKYSS